jgi:hypothetical protein
MAEYRKAKVPMADGTMSEGPEIPVVRAQEPWTELELEDGTILRMKNVVVSVIRLDGKFDQEDNPVYVIKSAQATSVVHVPEKLKKKKSK